jgi:uncharacterized protein (DUF433 family)
MLSAMPSQPPNLSAFADGTPLAEIAAAYGVTLRDVRRGIRRGRVQASPPRPTRGPDLDAEIVRRYLAMEGINKIVAASHIGAETVHDVLDRHGVERRPHRVPRRVQVAAVAALYEQGLNRAEIAAELGCTEVDRAEAAP